MAELGRGLGEHNTSPSPRLVVSQAATISGSHAPAWEPYVLEHGGNVSII